MNFLSPQWTLLSGFFLAIFLQNTKFQNIAKKFSGSILQLSVIFLGAALNFKVVINQSGTGVLVTFLSISFVFIVGYLGTKFFKVDKEQGLLITMGTAICGGSAIGALAPVLKAKDINIAISIGVVFLLNALAIFIFPPIGKFLSLTQEQFGLWSALAIHDTSSVVATAAIYGDKALEIGTLNKLVRALWIIPIVFIFSIYNQHEIKSRTQIPWFIVGFLLMSLVFTFFNISDEIKNLTTSLSKLGFALTLFLIGLSFNLNELTKVGFRPLILGISLWILTGLTTLGFIVNYT